MTALTNPDISAQLAAISAKLDRLQGDVDVIRQRQRKWDELGEDLVPIGKEAYQALVGELAALDPYFQLEDLLGLGRKLLRNTRGLSHLFDQLGSVQDLAADLRPLGKEFMAGAVEGLDGAERRGYFVFARELLGVVDRVVTSYSAEDVRALGENIVTILNTVRNLTQPELLAAVNHTMALVRHEEARPVGLFGILKAMRDPDVQRGVGMAIQMLKHMSAQPPTCDSAGCNPSSKTQ